MKKLSSALVALMLGASAVFAQGATDINFALPENGATATASSKPDEAAKAIDGNDDTRWESEHGSDDVWFKVDLGQLRTFNTVQIRWEGAYAASFRIEYSVDDADWKTFTEISDQQLAGFPYEQNLDVATPVQAQFVRFQGVKRALQYGYSFYSFRVLNASASILTSLSATPANELCKLGESTPILLTAQDQNGKSMQVDNVQYTIEPANAGSVTDNVYTPAQTGLATITARVGEITAVPFTIFTYAGENLALSENINESKIIAQSDFAPNGTDAYHAVDPDKGSVWQGCPNNGTDNDEVARTYDAWFVLDLGGYYDINLVTIKFEGACSQEYHLDFSLDNKEWNLAYNYVGDAGINGHTDMLYGDNLQNNTAVRFVRFYSTKAATQYGMKIFDMQVFGTEGTAPDDNELPVMVSATLVSSEYNSAVIAVEATDNMAVAKYRVQDKANAFDARFAPAQGNITVTGLKTNTTYNLAITALDLAGNESAEAKTVQLTTPLYNPEPTQPAPKPAHDASKVLSVYSDSYTPACQIEGFSQDWWSPASMEEKAVEGDNYLRYFGNMTGMVGWQFSPIDASKMTHLHVDIWASVSGVITMGPTYGGEGKETHVESIALTVEQEKWNSFDIELKNYPALDLTSIFQNQFTQYGAQTEFSVDNFYFWTTATSALPNLTDTEPAVTKIIQNGQLVIIRNGIRYDVLGNVIQ